MKISNRVYTQRVTIEHQYGHGWDRDVSTREITLTAGSPEEMERKMQTYIDQYDTEGRSLDFGFKTDYYNLMFHEPDF